MRGIVPGLASPFPLLERLPAVLQEDEFLSRFLLAFDDALAPVHATLDGLECYIDPRFAPTDFLHWVAEWVGAEVNDSQPPHEQRAAVLAAVSLHRRRGTLRGLLDAVTQVAGRDATVTVVEGGGTAWSATPGAPLPGNGARTVTLTIQAGHAVDEAGVRRVVAATVPAHLAHRIVFSGTPETTPPTDGGTS